MSQKIEMTVRNQRFSILKQPIASVLIQHLIDYPTPSNLSYWWGFGSLDGICLVIHIVIGIFLAMHYTPHVDLAFNSVEHIMRYVEGGWLLDICMRTGLPCSLSSYICTCSVAYIMRVIAVLGNLFGYVLPGGQMSFWGATVITILASAIPVVGDTIVPWLWGGFSVDNKTLNQFFSLHYLLLFILVGASVHAEIDKIAFYPYFYVKDLVGWVSFAIFFSFWIFYAPNFLGHPDNYIPANPMSTPAHIVPEWYFLPVYAILRSIPYKEGGVSAIALISIFLLALPFMKSPYVRSSSFHPTYQGLFWLLLEDRCLLGWIRCHPVEPPFVTIGGIPHSYTDEPVAEKDPIIVRH
ncbi:hypothetical protein C5167_037213 [Papaver somniferum]|uniref:Cytochrome b n=1 Tax=Papaver somniferum TaxID=3469 RepID=A0A4Y7I639_PAPSO|nr:hypothetical protein C5167_037213 [Papaver somniferum]